MRELIASACVKELKPSVPFIVDVMKNTANRCYSGGPDGISSDGEIAYKDGRAPWRFEPAQAKKVQTNVNSGETDTKDFAKKETLLNSTIEQAVYRQ
ncbi:MAG: hypothetical protein P1V97_07620 [Planctomycetota bacterium]|nr:hypothetical protein [Planctomycetota bacterium]